MKKILRHIGSFCALGVWLCVSVFLCASVSAQQQGAGGVPQTRIGSIFPLGAKAGTTVELKVASGTDLDDLSRLHFSHPGITAAPLMSEPNRVYPQGRATANTFKVTVAADVPPGIYEIRASGYFGISNARRFVVGDREEALEKEPNNEVEQAQEPPLGAVVNGACEALNSDSYRVAAKKGQRYIVDCQALRVDSRAQVVLTLIDASGRELRRSVGTKDRDPFLDFTAEADGPHVVRINDLLHRGGDEYGYRLSIGTGPWIDFVDPPVLKPGADNAVTVYGRNLPGGTPAEGVTLDGRPLEKLAVTIKAPAEAAPAFDTLLRPADASADLFSWRLPGSNPVRLLLGDEPLVSETEPNDAPDKAQALKAPVQFVGRFQQRGDRDGVIFDAAKGDKLWIEVFSNRLGHPTDPQIVVQQVTTSDKGETTYKDLQEADDQATPLPAMGNNMERRYRAHPEDPAMLFAVPADGKFRVMVRDLFGSAQGDPRFLYRLVIRPARPDFRLLAFPVEAIAAENRFSAVTCNLRRGGSERVRVVAFRREGFDGAIQVEAQGLPAGVTARPRVINPADTSVDLILQAAPDAAAYAGPLKIAGKAGDIARVAQAAEILWGAADMQKDPMVTRMTDTIALAVDSHFVAPFSAQIATEAPLRMAKGGKLKVPVKLVKQADFKDIDKAKIKLTPTGLPGKGNEKPIVTKEITLDIAKPDGEIELDVTDKAPLGTFTFHVVGDVDVPYVRNPERVKRAGEEQKRIDAVAAEIAAELKPAGEARQKAEQEAQQAAQALAALKAAGKAEAEVKVAEEKAHAADEAKAKAVDAEKKLQELAKLVDPAKKEAAAEVKAATDAAKERKAKVWIAALPVSVEIVNAPASLKTDKETVTVKPGESVEVEVEVVREFGFADEVKLELVVPQGVAIRLAQPVAIAPKDAKAKIALAADKALKPGTHAVTIRGQLKFGARAVTIEKTVQIMVEAPANP